MAKRSQTKQFTKNSKPKKQAVKHATSNTQFKIEKVESEKKWVVLNDLQLPFEDKDVLWGLVVPFIRELKPHGVVLNGDVLDHYEISDYSKDPALRGTDLKQERQSLDRLLNAVTPVTKERWFIEGNHEDRYRRYIWSRVPELAAAGSMPSFAEAFRLADYGFKHRPYGGHVMLGKLMVTHGFLVAQHSAMSAKRHFERLGTSVLIGHTHRLGIYHVRNQAGDHAAYENGCLCRLDGLGYAQFPQWQQGFSVVDILPGGTFNVQQIPILARRMFIYGNTVVRRGA
jgi:hypothetical protein